MRFVTVYIAHMLKHLTPNASRIIPMVAFFAAVLFLAVAPAPTAAQQDEDTEVELSFGSPDIDAAYDALAIFVDGALCADIPVANLSMPVILGEGCVENGSTIDLLLYSEDGVQASRVSQSLVAFLGEPLTVKDWATEPAETALPGYMSAYVDALDGSPPAESPVDGTVSEDGKAPQLPEVGNLGWTPDGTSTLLLAAALLGSLLMVAGARRITQA